MRLRGIEVPERSTAAATSSSATTTSSTATASSSSTPAAGSTAAWAASAHHAAEHAHDGVGGIAAGTQLSIRAGLGYTVRYPLPNVVFAEARKPVHLSALSAYGDGIITGSGAVAEARQCGHRCARVSGRSGNVGCVF